MRFIRLYYGLSLTEADCHLLHTLVALFFGKRTKYRVPFSFDIYVRVFEENVDTVKTEIPADD